MSGQVQSLVQISQANCKDVRQRRNTIINIIKSSPVQLNNINRQMQSKKIKSNLQHFSNQDANWELELFGLSFVLGEQNAVKCNQSGDYFIILT